MNDDNENIFDETVRQPADQPTPSEGSFGAADTTTTPAESCPAETENTSIDTAPSSQTPREHILLESPLELAEIEQSEAPMLLEPTVNNKQISQRQIPTAVAFLVFGILVGSMFPVSHDENRKTPGARDQATNVVSLATPQERTPTNFETPNHKNTFENIELEARAAYVWDINTREALFKKNADSKLPLASLAKIMTAVTIADQVPKGTVITIDKNALTTEGDTGLLSGEQWRLRDLLEFTLLVSSNDGAAALASIASLGSSTSNTFVNSMNAKAQEIGLTQSYFSNPSGLDTNEHESGAYGSARDMARLFEYGLKNIPEALEATTYRDMEITSLSGFTHDAKNTNVLIDKIPALIASKTGFTNLAGGNLVIAFEAGPGKQIVVVVLGSTYDGRFSDVEKLVWATLEHLENQ